MQCDKHEDLVVAITELKVMFKEIKADIKEIKDDMKTGYWKIIPLLTLLGGVVVYFLKG